MPGPGTPQCRAQRAAPGRWRRGAGDTAPWRSLAAVCLERAAPWCIVPSPRMPPRTLSVGDILAFNLGHGWSACQVLRVASKHVEVVGLDHWSADRPTLAAVTLRPLLIDHHFWAGSLHHMNVSGPPPESFVALGAAPLVLPEAMPCNSYGAWGSFPLQARLQLRWNAFPEAARTAFRAARDLRTPVTLRLPSGEVSVPVSRDKVTLEFGPRIDPDALHIDRAADFDFGALDVLPVLLSVSVTGDAPGLLDWLRTRPLIEKLSWQGVLPTRIDLRGTNLRECALDADGAHELVVPDTLEGLALTPSATARWNVTARDEGARLALRLDTWDGDGIAHVTGLGRTPSLSLSGVGSLDLRPLAEHFHPREFSVHGAPGELRGSDALAAFDALETLKLWGCLSVDAAHMPPLSRWPYLARVDVVEALDAEAVALKAAWGRDKRVSVRAAHDAAWARHHGAHPFRRWRDERKRADVGAAFASASKKLDAAGVDAAAVTKVMQGFVKALTRAHTRGAGFTAAEVADIEAAWATLLARAAGAVDDATAAVWLARGRKGW